MSTEKTTGKAVAWFKKHAVKIGITVVLVAAAVWGWCYTHPFKYIDIAKYTVKQRRAILAEAKKIEASEALKKAVQDAATAGKVTYRKALEEAAFAAWKAAHPTEVK